MRTLVRQRAGTAGQGACARRDSPRSLSAIRWTAHITLSCAGLVNVLALRCAIGVCLAAAPTLVTAQEPARRWRLWGAVGLGGGGSSTQGGMASVAEVAFQRAPHQVSLRSTFMFQWFGDGCDPGGGDIGILYGRTATGILGHATLASGLALTWPFQCGGGENASIGIPVVAEAAVRPASVVGLGLQAFANLNGRSTFSGVVLFLQLGWLPR